MRRILPVVLAAASVTGCIFESNPQYTFQVEILEEGEAPPEFQLDPMTTGFRFIAPLAATCETPRVVADVRENGRTLNLAVTSTGCPATAEADTVQFRYGIIWSALDGNYTFVAEHFGDIDRPDGEVFRQELDI